MTIMALEDIDGLPDVVAQGQVGHREAHEKIHAGLKSVKSELSGRLSNSTLDAAYAPASALIADDLINEWWVAPTAHYMAPPLDRTYWCGTSRSGEIVVGYTDHRLGKTHQEVVGIVAQPDDHSVPALMMADGEIPTANTASRIPPKAAIVFWTEHNRTNTVHLRRAKKYWSIRDWHPEQTIDFGGPVSYTQVFRGEGGTGGVGADTLVLIARVSDRYWSVCRSLDYGATWTAPVKFLDYGEGQKGYFIGVQSNHTDGTGRDLIHFAMYGHPTESTKPDIRTGTMLMNSALEVRTPNGSGGSTLLGNVSGLASPFTAEQFRASITIAAGQNSRLFYISDRFGKPEIAYAQWADGQHTTSQYKYAVAPTLYGNYTVRDVAQSGINFGESAVKHYIAGMCFPPKTPGQVVYYGREQAGVWYIEKAVTTDDGATWTKTIVASGDKAMIRPACPLGGGPYEVLWSRLAHYSQDEGGGADYLADLMGGSS